MHTGRRSGQSLARNRHTSGHEAQLHARRIFRKNGVEGRQSFLPQVLAARRSMRKKTRLGLDELERALDLRAKLRGRQQLVVNDEGK